MQGDRGQTENKGRADASAGELPHALEPNGSLRNEGGRRRDFRVGTLLLVVGLVVGTLFASVLFAQSKKKTPVPEDGLTATSTVTAPFDIVDTPGSTYLLNRSTGQVWRLGFTEVKGDRYWFGTHVPVQQPGTFEEFQQGLRKRLGAGN